MKIILQKAALIVLTAFSTVAAAQVDLVVGLNYAYTPPSNCNNQLTGISIDICNNGSSSASSFLVGIYLYDPSSTKYWVLDQVSVTSLSGNACKTISNWNIDMNNYASLPAPGSNYRIGAWVDTANVVSESNENNNTALLSGNVQICGNSTSIKSISKSLTSFEISPNPVTYYGKLSFNLLKAEILSAKIYDITGALVVEVFNGKLGIGEQIVNFDIGNLSSGIYIVSINTPTGIVTKKLMIQK